MNQFPRAPQTELMDFDGNPEGSLDGPSSLIVKNPLTGDVYIKKTPQGIKTGWKSLLSEGFVDFDLGGEAAPAALTAAASPSAGNLTGTYTYRVAFVNALGQTVLGAASNSVAVTAKQMLLAGIPLGGSTVTARRLYRTKGVDPWFYLLATINDNTTTTYTDNLADVSLETLIGEGRIHMDDTTIGGLYIGTEKVLHTGEVNTFVGRGAGASMVNGAFGYNNTFVGADAGFTNTNGYFGTFIGYQAGYSNTSGFPNTALGAFSLFSNINGAALVGGGYRSLYFNGTGSFNTAFGYRASHENVAGNYNTAFGYDALYNNSASENLSIGPLSMYNNTTGTRNTVMGVEAGRYQTTQNDNTFIGYQAGRHLGELTGNENTCLGSLAGKLSVNHPVNNTTCIGYNSRVDADNTIGIGDSRIVSVVIGGATHGLSKLHVDGPDAADSGAAPTGGVCLSNTLTDTALTAGVDTATGTNYAWLQSRNKASTAKLGLALNPSGGAVTVGVKNPSAGASFQIDSTTGCLLPPRLTTAQRDALTTPVNGLIFYNTTTDKLQVRAGAAWVDLH